MALERCIKACFAFGRRWEEGEVRTSNSVDSEGRPLPSYPYFTVLPPNVEVDPADVYDEAQVSEVRKEFGGVDKQAAILRALDQLDPDDDSHWTARGFPSVSVIQELTQLDVQRSDVSETLPDFTREYARSNKG